MKMKMNLLLLAMATLTLSGCTSAFYGSTSTASDDLYAMHNRTEIARRQQAEAEARKAEAEARKAEVEAMIAEAAARSSEDAYYNRSTGENFTSVLADDYESAYARRLRGMESPTYRMPSSYTNARYSTTFHYVSAYDPAFYNIMVMGDQVWVEPKYVTAMFGTWGLPSYSRAWYWNRWTSPWWAPSFSIGFGGWGWNIGLSWYDPWFYDWYSPWYRPWGGYYYGWHNHYWHNHYWHGHGPHWNGGGGYHPGHRPGAGRPGIVHRPSQNRYTRPYQSQGSTINRGQSGNRNWSSGVYQDGNRGQSGRGQGSGTVSRTPNNSQSKPSYNSGTSRRSRSTGSNSSSYRSSGSWNSNNSSSNSSWGSSSSSRGGSYSSGSSGGGYSGGGGGSRGGSSGSSSRGR